MVTGTVIYNPHVMTRGVALSLTVSSIMRLLRKCVVEWRRDVIVIENGKYRIEIVPMNTTNEINIEVTAKNGGEVRDLLLKIEDALMSRDLSFAY